MHENEKKKSMKFLNFKALIVKTLLRESELRYSIDNEHSSTNSSPSRTRKHKRQDLRNYRVYPNYYKSVQHYLKLYI